MSYQFACLKNETVIQIGEVRNIVANIFQIVGPLLILFLFISWELIAFPAEKNIHVPQIIVKKCVRILDWAKNKLILSRLVTLVRTWYVVVDCSSVALSVSTTSSYQISWVNVKVFVRYVVAALNSVEIDKMSLQLFAIICWTIETKWLH